MGFMVFGSSSFQFIAQLPSLWYDETRMKKMRNTRTPGQYEEASMTRNDIFYL